MTLDHKELHGLGKAILHLFEDGEGRTLFVRIGVKQAQPCYTSLKEAHNGPSQPMWFRAMSCMARVSLYP